MKKFILFFLLVFVLVACGGNAEPSAPASDPAGTAPEAETLPVAGTPQLIEFYADW